MKDFLPRYVDFGNVIHVDEIDRHLKNVREGRSARAQNMLHISEHLSCLRGGIVLTHEI